VATAGEAASRRTPCQLMSDITYAINIPADPNIAAERTIPVLSSTNGLGTKLSGSATAHASAVQ
jgi:hypothetical protein